jgi:hypothetical protein
MHPTYSSGLSAIARLARGPAGPDSATIGIRLGPVRARAGHRRTAVDFPKADKASRDLVGRDGWFCDGLLYDGETRIRTFIWWINLAGSVTVAL